MAAAGLVRAACAEWAWGRAASGWGVGASAGRAWALAAVAASAGAACPGWAWAVAVTTRRPELWLRRAAVVGWVRWCPKGASAGCRAAIKASVATVDPAARVAIADPAWAAPAGVAPGVTGQEEAADVAAVAVARAAARI